MEQAQPLPNKAQPRKKQQQQQPEVTHPVESKDEPQVDTKEETKKVGPQVGTKEETKKVVKVDNMTITYN